MSSRGVAPSNDAFAGGAQQRNLYPPGVGGANLSANTRVSSPAAGVAPGQIKSALNNSTSNIGIPYQRLVPLNNSNKLIGMDENGKTVVRKETEDLRATSLAFILGIRGDSKPPRPLLAGNEQAPGVPGHNVAYQPDIMPAMVGTERFQQLCSIEYLHEYFKQVLAGKTIALDTTYADATAAMQGALKTSGPISVYEAAVHEAKNAGIPENAPGRPNIAPTNTLLKMPDLAKQMGLEGSEASEAPGNYQGIFARDFGPFLKGKGTKTELVHGTLHNLPQLYNPEQPDIKKKYSAQPFCLSRNFGDDVAFSLLDAKLLENGITDWRPDGIVLSKGINDPSDQLSNEYLEARDGQLCARAFRTLRGRDAYAYSCSRETAPTCAGSTSASRAPPSAPRGRASARSRCCRSTRYSSSSWPTSGLTPGRPPSTTHRSSRTPTARAAVRAR